MEIYEYKEYLLNYNSAYNEGLILCEKKIKEMLKSGEYIIGKKVLKKEVKSGKMNIEVFFKIYRNMGITSNIEIIGEEDAEYN